MNEVDLGAKALYLLIGAGALSGIASLWVFRRWSDAEQLRTAANRIVAHLFELELFAEEPAVVLRAQGDLFIANAKLLRQVALPSLVLIVPFSILVITLDAVCSRAPLQPGRPAIVTVQCRVRGATRLPPAKLDVPAGFQIETPPVRVPMSSQISWRIRPLRSVRGDLKVLLGSRSISKSISSAAGLQWLSDIRAGSLLDFLIHPLELPYSDTAVQYISVVYPAATVFNLNWMVWFLAASFVPPVIYIWAIHQQ